MLAAIPSVVRFEERRPLWEFLLRGLWLSGLRIGEAVAVTWDDTATIRVDFSGEYPLMHFPAGSHKSGEECSLPIPPDLAKLLETVPVDQRTGKVFKLSGSAGLTVTEIGKAACIVVKRRPDGTAEKYASAHDLRRSFGQRWAAVLMPAKLQELMRHKSILTTMRYYATGDAQALAQSIWDCHRRPDADAKLQS